MRRGAGGTLAGLALVAVLTGCTQDAPTAQTRGGLDSWTPPEDAPAFCTALAGAEHLDGLPEAVGRLVADPADAQHARALTEGAGEVREARDAVREEGGHRELEALLDDLAEALAGASSAPLAAGSPERIGDGLRAVGGYVQPLCEFPT